MEKKMKGLKVALMVGLMSLASTPAFARSISIKEAGWALWIFVIIGAIIVLLQLIPAAILFFSFIGTTTSMVFKKERKAEQEVVSPAVSPVVIEK
jgi:NADH:ubiquinone oxidoreductase subunit 5 (subunit L)/multisubunit Na+/H+ antiporter MnhA subunit